MMSDEGVNEMRARASASDPGSSHGFNGEQRRCQAPVADKEAPASP